jgi:glucose/arabinose dehydrogenase
MSPDSDEHAPADPPRAADGSGDRCAGGRETGTPHGDSGPRDGDAPGRPLPTASRRRLLAATAAGLAGVAGCSSAGPSTTDGGDGDGQGADGDGDGSDGDGTGSDGDGDGTGPDGDGDGDGTGSDGDGDGDGTDTDSDGDGDGSTNVGRAVEEWSGYDPDWEAPTTSPLDADLETEVLIENLEIPWDMAFAPDGTLFITERVGRVRKFDGEEVRTVAEPDSAIDAASLEPGSDRSEWLIQGGEGGTLGIAVHPSFPDPAHVFVYYTYKSDDGKHNRVEAFDVRSDDPSTPVRTVVDEIAGATYHNGGRITFGPRNYLWITCGDGLNFGDAQETDILAGKILRVTPEGDPAPGNPDLGADADPRIYTYGHRNPQGIVWLPDGTPIITEHGPGYGGDEFNRLEAGANYGWDVKEKRTRKREEYPDSDVHRPVYNTGTTSFAPTGALFYDGDAVPALENRMLVGGLISEQLVVTAVTPAGEELPPADDAHEQVPADTDWNDDAYGATVHTLFEGELGRIRHVEQSPDGDIYVCTSNRDGRASEEFPREVDDVLVRITQS